MGDFTVQFGRLVAYRGESAEVVVPDNVTVIGRRAFHFSNVTSVTLPDSVTEIEQEAFLYAKLTHIQFGHGIKKIGADAFLCDLDKKEYLYPKLPIAVFSKGDQRRALYHFVHNAKAGNYTAEVYKKNLTYVRSHLLDEIEYKRVCIDTLMEDPELLKEVLASGKIPATKLDSLISQLIADNKADALAFVLQYQQR